MKTRTLSSTLLTLALCFSTTSHAYTAVENLPYTYENATSYWRVDSHGDFVAFKLQNTKIEYTWKNSIRASNVFYDSDHNVISPKPARSLWAPHPTTVQTVEEVFLNALQAVGYPSIQVPYLKEVRGVHYVSDIGDFLSVYRKLSPPMTAEAFLRSVQLKVNKTSNELIFGKQLERTYIPAFANVVEPIKSGNRYDAFNLFPLLTYRKDKSAFINEMNRWLQAPVMNVMELFQKSSVSESVRISLLALLTHNHLVEVNLLKYIALNEGVDASWKMAKMINLLYQREQEFWRQGTQRHDILRGHNKNLLRLFGKTEFAPFNDFVILESHPVFLANTCSDQNPVEGFDLSMLKIPAIRSYHFYGSLITAQRMYSLRIPLKIAEKINGFLVAQYKSHSDANAEEITYLKNLYRLGTRYVYNCR